MNSYCEKHHVPMEMISVNGQWVLACPICQEDRRIVYNDRTEILPRDQWTIDTQSDLHS